MLHFLRKITPRLLLRAYHYALAVMAAAIYRHPSEQLIVIGVTGTSGKSTVAHLVSQMLEKAGFRVGAASTIFFKIDKKEWSNDKKMTMVGRLALQRLLRQMVRANCQYAVIETTSQGIEQFRHLGINYDVLVFTNLYPEHIEAHGSFENYKNAKLKLFKKLANDQPKMIARQRIVKTMVVNLDDSHALDFLAQPAEEKYIFGFAEKMTNDKLQILNKLQTPNLKISHLRAEKIEESADGLKFEINQQPFAVKLLGRHTVYNILAAAAVGVSQGLQLPLIASLLQRVKPVPGRLEFIDEGQDFAVIVDYAFEPRAAKALYQTIASLKHRRIIHVLGSAGGGRDKSRRPILGRLAASHADVVIVTNEDPYDEDPQSIIDQVAHGSLEAGKIAGKNLLTIVDRRQAIRRAFRLAQKNDLVLITGKGSEQAIVVKNNKKIPWDDRTVVREELELRTREVSQDP